MKSTNAPNPLAKILYMHCDVNAITGDWPRSLRDELNRPESKELRDQFKEQLLGAIRRHAISLTNYEALTGEEFESEDEFEKRLRELYEGVFGGTLNA